MPNIILKNERPYGKHVVGIRKRELLRIVCVIVVNKIINIPISLLQFRRYMYIITYIISHSCHLMQVGMPTYLHV